MRGILVVLAAAVVLGAAAPAPDHSKLDGFMGVPFGAPMAAARAALGPDARPGTNAADKTGVLRIYRDVFGEPAMINFRFSNSDHMLLAYAVKALASEEGGKLSGAACYARAKRVVALAQYRYGAPVMRNDSPPDANDPLGPGFGAWFRFDDGAVIKVTEGACVMLVDVLSPEAARAAN